MCQKEEIALMAVKSMVYEVSATPKPGLVDRRNNGAHDDMDYNLFLNSSISFDDCLEEIVEIGYSYAGDDYEELFNKIRKVGLRAEEKMFECTGGINTHKGILFSLCLLSGAAGHLLKKNGEGNMDPEEVCSLAGKMVKGITQKELHKMNKDRNLTHGEKLFRKYGVTGIRGEAESGFLSVLNYGLPVLRENYECLELNDLLIQVLFSLMSQVDDTNVLYRHDHEELINVKDKAKKFLDQGGMNNKRGIEKVISMDSEFIDLNISPGGSADLLAITVFLGLLQGIKL